MRRGTAYSLFLVMCLVWGLTWIAIKIGLASVPPLFFAGTRFTVAGVILLAWDRCAPRRPGVALEQVRRADWGGMLVAALLVIVSTYSLLFWGMRHVPSGLAAVLNLAFMPVAIFAIGLAYGEERFSARQLLAIALGIGGLIVLFRPAAGGRDSGELWGMAAIIGGTVAYCWGSVRSRKLLRAYAPTLVSGVTCLLGGLVLLALSAMIEPIDAATLWAFLSPAVAASWLFLVVFGSLVAFTIYLRLVRDWGTARASMYAFVSPIIAVLVGVFASGETMRTSDLLGMLIMLAATWAALGRREARRPA
jgi:drug/metabolite transporter (DMT)-like permease